MIKGMHEEGMRELALFAPRDRSLNGILLLSTIS